MVLLQAAQEMPVYATQNTALEAFKFLEHGSTLAAVEATVEKWRVAALPFFLFLKV
jgi:hypothetical protein